MLKGSRQESERLAAAKPPKGGLDIRKTCGTSLDEAIRQEAGVADEEVITICPNPTQNILVISTPDEKTATKIAKVKALTINGKKHETNAYVSAPEQMAKGIVRNIPLMYMQDQLANALVTTRNPSLTYAKRFGNTTNCGMKNPSNGHECTPKCRICGEGHPTADRAYKGKSATVAGENETRTRACSGRKEYVTRGDLVTIGVYYGGGERLRSVEIEIPFDDDARAAKCSGQCKVTWSGIAAGRECVEIPPPSGCPREAPDPALSARLEKLDRENKELRDELARARKRNET
ncbi:hypothetical protein HPB50_004371 [Hyalomma asiaticum]|uniref:Uncharacterized protein n=1 Tax=Hyalomma asiaticum TaxID=266040 RepID=A0ACB7RMJ2_HYAAI|nr:hypothetical protein HPB50_004371 [Hyalomma asiaticum]